MRPLGATTADRLSPAVDATCPKRTIGPHSPPAGRTRAPKRRLPARNASTRSPRTLIATAAVVETARSRGGDSRWPGRRSLTRTNGERSFVHAMIV
jgi:hypothetical protein